MTVARMLLRTSLLIDMCLVARSLRANQDGKRCWLFTRADRLTGQLKPHAGQERILGNARTHPQPAGLDWQTAVLLKQLVHRLQAVFKHRLELPDTLRGSRRVT